MATLLVTQCQRAVGQGGFQTTEIRFGDQAYRAVYDCGALPKDRCLAEIDAFAVELDGERSRRLDSTRIQADIGLRW